MLLCSQVFVAVVVVCSGDRVYHIGQMIYAQGVVPAGIGLALARHRHVLPVAICGVTWLYLVLVSALKRAHLIGLGSCKAWVACCSTPRLSDSCNHSIGHVTLALVPTACAFPISISAVLVQGMGWLVSLAAVKWLLLGHVSLHKKGMHAAPRLNAFPHPGCSHPTLSNQGYDECLES